MRKRTLLSGFLALALMTTIVSSAMAAMFERTITMGPGAGQFAIGDLGIGDTVVLTLVNPTNTPLTFETSQMLGPEQRWVVPPNSHQTVSFNYTRPFSDDVAFIVKEAGGAQVASGTLIPARLGERPVSYPTMGQPMQHMQMQPMQPREIPTARPVNVRGYW